MITNWIDIRTVLFELERIIPKDLYNEQRLINDCMRAVDMIGAVPTYEAKAVFKKVENYKACIPEGCLQLIQIGYKRNSNFDNADLDEINQLLGFDNEPLLANSSLPYQVWESSKYYYNHWEALKLSTDSFSLSMHCDGCVNVNSSCGNSYSVAPDGTLTFSFKEGYIYIGYYAYPTDCNGNYLIPDNEDYKEALRTYCLMTNWELRWNMKEEGAEQRYFKYQQLWSLFKAKATASIRMPDVAGHENAKNILNRLIPKTRRFSTFFKDLNNEESLRMNGSTFYYR